MKRAALFAAAIVALWLIALVILDGMLGRGEEARVSERVGESLQATATLGDSDLALLRGRLVLDKLAVRRDDLVGHLAIDVDRVRCELAPFGIALVDRDCRELAVKGVRLEVSTAALFHLEHRKRPPIHARRVVIDDAELAFSPSAFLPSLGKIAIHIDHGEAGDTVLRTPLSWLFTLETLRARIELPAGIELTLTYEGGMLSAAGSLFGSTPVRVPVTLPIASALRDANDELSALVTLGTSIAENLVARRAEDWLEQKLGN